MQKLSSRKIADVKIFHFQITFLWKNVLFSFIYQPIFMRLPNEPHNSPLYNKHWQTSFTLDMGSMEYVYFKERWIKWSSSFIIVILVFVLWSCIWKVYNISNADVNIITWGMLYAMLGGIYCFTSVFMISITSSIS